VTSREFEMPRLIIREMGRERVVELDLDKITIGRSNANTVPIKDVKASRAHCAIQRTDKGWFVLDLGSSNGTVLNGARVQRALLAMGDVISIGDAEIHFERVIEDKPATKRMDDSGYVAQVAGEGTAPAAAEVPAAPPAAEVQAAAQAAAPPRLDSVHADIGGARYLLRVLKGPGLGSTYPLGRDVFTIGRRGNNTLTLDDERVSSSHTQISREGSLWVLADLGSTNGTVMGGRKVTREILEHGTVFSIGGSTFQFVDIQGPELAGVRRAESLELGEPRGLPSDADFARIDVQQVLKRRGSNTFLTFLYAIAAVFLIVAVIYYSFHVFGRLLGRSSSVAPAKSLIKTNWSFEQRLGKGKVLEGWTTPSKGWSIDRQNAKTGKASLKLDCSVNSDPDDVLEVRAEPTTIASGRQYQVKVQVKMGQASKAGVKVVWSDPLNAYFVQESYSKLLSGESGSWKALRWTFIPPRRATRMELSLCAFGNKGAVRFDDVELEERDLETGTRESQTVSLKDEIEVAVDPRATWCLFRRGALIFWDAQVFLRDKDGSMGAFSRQALSEILKRASVSGDTMLYLGRIYEPHEGAWIPLTQEIRVREDLLSVRYKLTGEFKGTGILGVSFRARPDILSKSQKVEVTSAGGVQVFSADFEVSQVKEMVWGTGDNRISFTFPEPVDISANRIENSLRVTLAKSLGSDREAHFAVDFSVISLRQQRKVDDVFDTIARLRDEGKLQEPIDIARRFLLEGVMQEDEKKKLDGLIKDMEADGKALVSETQRIFDDFKKTHHPELLNNLSVYVESVKEAFPGGKKQREAESLLNDARVALKKVEKRRMDETAQKMLLAGDSYRERDMLGLAAVHYEYVRDNFAGTNWEKDAKAKLEQLRVQTKTEGRW
jgi:pSer/pThr/pTyr-binding forkhead associated (FHA) protein